MTQLPQKKAYICNRMNIQLTEKKEQIFFSTLKLINTHGFHGSPMSKIAKDADVAVGSIYHYFPSKEDLILELYWYCKEKLNNQVFSAVDPTLAYEKKFKQIWRNLVLYYLDNLDHFGFLEQFYGSPFYEGIRNNIFQQKSERNVLLHFLDEGVRLKHLKDLNVRLLISAYLGVAISLVRGCLYEKSKPTDQEIETMVDIIWNGVKK